MPQLVPLHFINESNSCFLIFIITTFVFSKHILPFFNCLFSVRYFLFDIPKTKKTY